MNEVQVTTVIVVIAIWVSGVDLVLEKSIRLVRTVRRVFKEVRKFPA